MSNATYIGTHMLVVFGMGSDRIANLKFGNENERQRIAQPFGYGQAAGEPCTTEIHDPGSDSSPAPAQRRHTHTGTKDRGQRSHMKELLF